MEKPTRVEQECLNYIEQVKVDMYQAGESDDVMSHMKYEALKTSIYHLEHMLTIIQTTK